MKQGRRMIIYSENYSRLLKLVVPQLVELAEERLGLGDTDLIGSSECPVHVKALMYAGKGTEPDLSGALETVGDVLQAAVIIENDRWIKSWDGSRVLTDDKDNPRTEITLEPFYG